MADKRWADGSKMTTPTKKAVCPMCKRDRTHKRKRAPGYYCHTCKVAFKNPLIIESEKTEANK